VAGHTVGERLQIVGLTKDDVTQPRNFLRLHKVLEKDFDHKRIIFEYHEVNADDFKLKLQVLDPDFLTEKIAYNNQAPISVQDINTTLSDFIFSSARKPYLRALAVHFQKFMTRAKEKGWVVDGVYCCFPTACHKFSQNVIGASSN
jgi:hypothetical protein